MLEIKPVKSYKLPGYPQGIYCAPPESYLGRRTAIGIATAATVALLGCTCYTGPPTPPVPGSGMAGPPPVRPDLVTENEARALVNQVFAQNGINLEVDVPFSFTRDQKETITLELDGFNKDLKVGYEYISPEDESTFTTEVVEELRQASSVGDDGPCIGTFDPITYYGEFEQPDLKRLESLVQEFIDGLRSRGIL